MLAFGHGMSCILPGTLRQLFVQSINESSLIESPPFGSDLLSAADSPYTHWGFLENDVYMGNLSHFFPPEVLAVHDAFSTRGANMARPAGAFSSVGSTKNNLKKSSSIMITPIVLHFGECDD